MTDKGNGCHIFNMCVLYVYIFHTYVRAHPILTESQVGGKRHLGTSRGPCTLVLQDKVSVRPAELLPRNPLGPFPPRRTPSVHYSPFRVTEHACAVFSRLRAVFFR